ncbi:MAG TPA: hypothetical protein VJT73_11485 [Polyangiaceae bacterium]|nr:hypothetical protein [Polyangiaceae bacterium]
MTRRERYAPRFGGGVLIAVLALGCKTRSSDEERRAAQDARAVAPSPIVASSPPPHVPANMVAATERGCRVMRHTGTASLRRSPEGSPAPLADGELLPPRATVELAPGAELTIRSTVSTREFGVSGPASFEACAGGEEAIRLALGKVTGFPGMGVRPGAEVWVATPLGVVRFNDSKIDIEVRVGSLTVASASGRASFMPLLGVRLDPASSDAGVLDEVFVLAGSKLVADRLPTPIPKLLADLVGMCATQAALAEDAGKKVASLARPDGGNFGDLAFAHVRARQRARAACEGARAALSLKPGALDSALVAQLGEAEETWKRPYPISN